jgi:hypothetical protein
LDYKTTHIEWQRVLPAFAHALSFPASSTYQTNSKPAIFSCIDSFKGYHQIPMALQDIAIAIKTPLALFEYLFKHLPFLFTYWTTS